MNEPYPPAVPIPTELGDHDAAQLIDFLYELARVLENHYAGQLHRNRTAASDEQLELWQNPPF